MAKSMEIIGYNIIQGYYEIIIIVNCYYPTTNINDNFRFVVQNWLLCKEDDTCYRDSDKDYHDRIDQIIQYLLDENVIKKFNNKSDRLYKLTQQSLLKIL